MHFGAFPRAFCPWDLIPSAHHFQWVVLGLMVARLTNFWDPNQPPPTPVAVFCVCLWKKHKQTTKRYAHMYHYNDLGQSNMKLMT